MSTPPTSAPPHTPPARDCPLRKVSTSYPPTVLVHGTADTDVPHEESVRLAARLAAAGVPHRLLSLPGVGHGLAGAQQEEAEAVEAELAAFLAARISLALRGRLHHPPHECHHGVCLFSECGRRRGCGGRGHRQLQFRSQQREQEERRGRHDRCQSRAGQAARCPAIGARHSPKPKPLVAHAGAR